MTINTRSLAKAARVGERAQRMLKTITDYLAAYDLDVLDFYGAYAPELNSDPLHSLSTAKMVEFVFGSGPMEAPTGLRVTVLGEVTALAVELMAEAEKRENPLFVVKPKREYLADGSNGKFHLREFVNTVQKVNAPVETFTTRKQAEHVAALLNEALAW